MQQTKKQPQSRTITLVRHAQSTQNKAKRDIMAQLSADEVLQQSQAYHAMLYSPQYMDAPLSELGIQQTQQTKSILKDQHYDLVLVSPFRRALQTCDLIFGDRQGVQFVVEPLLGECVCTACDVGSRIEQSVQIYGGRYDFSRVVQGGRGKYWYVDLLASEEVKLEITEEEGKIGDVHEAALNVMRRREELESVDELRKRCELLRLKLREYTTDKDKKVAVVSHFFLLKHLTAKQSTQDSSQTEGITILNGQFIEWTLHH